MSAARCPQEPHDLRLAPTARKRRSLETQNPWEPLVVKQTARIEPLGGGYLVYTKNFQPAHTCYGIFCKADSLDGESERSA